MHLAYPFRKFLFPKNSDLDFSLKSGVYYVKNDMQIPEILELLSSGQQEYIKISIPEGFTISKIAELLEQNRVCSKNDFINISKDKNLLSKYQIPADSCEGYLFPDTYFFTLGMKTETVICSMLDNFFEEINTIPNLSEKNPESLLLDIKDKDYPDKLIFNFFYEALQCALQLLVQYFDFTNKELAYSIAEIINQTPNYQPKDIF